MRQPALGQLDPVLQRRRSRWTGLVNFLVLAGSIIPPAPHPQRDERAFRDTATHSCAQAGPAS